ncbi:MAG TPA: VirB4 family type IV secretion/conjugal transfer ATPase [Candidatus Dormibacteraeota bacterium]|nr:VirB4 family type IV secretion/conjugal transfer ATPase [Candidatus Dormibacteraeota bacterium]
MNCAGTRALRRERSAAELIPYTAHVAERIVRTGQGDYLQAFRLGGAGFECADDAQLNNWHERLNVLWRNLAQPNVSIWTHLLRRPERAAIPCAGGGGFADALALRYQQRLAGETLMVNELYLAVLYRPVAGATASLLSRLLRRSGAARPALELADAVEACAKLAQLVGASLARYEPEALGTYRRGAIWCSSLLEYLALLVNGEWQPMPLPSGPVAAALTSTRLLFGSEAIEYRLPHATRVGAVLGIKEYPTPSTVGMLNRLLSAPYPLLLSQSFTFLSRAAGQGLLQRQYLRMANAGDLAVSQAAQLQQALDALSCNEFVMGDHHFSLQVLADIEPEAADVPDSWRLRLLNERVALARSLLADTGMTVAREDLALEAAFWGQLPGNFGMRVRKAPLTSRNFAALAPFHNFPRGRPSGNHWGDALALLCTSARSPYYFSLHASDPADPEGGRKDTGHTFICGPTGSGKTVFIGFLVCLLQRHGATQVIFDKDRGLEILVRALDGEYFELRHGEPSGFNPLQLPATPQHLEFLKLWLRVLVRPTAGRPLTAREVADLEQALRGTLALEAPARRLSRLLEFLDPTDPEGVHARLARWCAAAHGEYAWAFDNPRDSLLLRLSARPTVGFDVSEFLGHELLRTPLTLYVFHVVRQLLDGRRLVCWMDEFWRLLGDPAFESFAKEGPKTWRKLNGVMCLATQSAGDVLDSPISRTIIEQTPTKVFFPNGDASAEEYMQGFGLTEREFRLIKEQLDPGARAFLVKQGPHSIVCRLDLKGCDAELAVISGRARELEQMQRLIAAHGRMASQWLPAFMGAPPRA